MAAHVYHYKHGWIPLDHADAAHAAGITNRRDLAGAINGLPAISSAADRMAAKHEVRKAAIRLNVASLLPGDTPITRRRAV